jgi:hypothetical protein
VVKRPKSRRQFEYALDDRRQSVVTEQMLGLPLYGPRWPLGNTLSPILLTLDRDSIFYQWPDLDILVSICASFSSACARHSGRCKLLAPYCRSDSMPPPSRGGTPMLGSPQPSRHLSRPGASAQPCAQPATGALPPCPRFGSNIFNRYGVNAYYLLDCTRAGE